MVRLDLCRTLLLFLLLTFGASAVLYGLIIGGAGMGSPLVLVLMWVPGLTVDTGPTALLTGEFGLGLMLVMLALAVAVRHGRRRGAIGPGAARRSRSG